MNIRNIRYWVSAADWAGPFEAAKKHRVDEIGCWVTRDKKAWLAEDAFSNVSANFPKRVMVVSGIYNVLLVHSITKLTIHNR